ncbi:unnamed protein product [Pylaiella littoralis]
MKTLITPLFMETVLSVSGRRKQSEVKVCSNVDQHLGGTCPIFRRYRTAAYTHVYGRHIWTSKVKFVKFFRSSISLPTWVNTSSKVSSNFSKPAQTGPNR